jgi:hypothetical protein
MMEKYGAAGRLQWQRRRRLSCRHCGYVDIAVASLAEIRKARDRGSDALDRAAMIAPLNDDFFAEPSGLDVDAAEEKETHDTRGCRWCPMNSRSPVRP